MISVEITKLICDNKWCKVRHNDMELGLATEYWIKTDRVEDAFLLKRGDILEYDAINEHSRPINCEVFSEVY